MKKRFLLSLLVIVTFFAIMGCGKSNGSNNQKTNDNKDVVTIQGQQYKLKSEQSLQKLHYKENYIDFYSDAIGNMRTMSFFKQEKLIFEVRMMYDESRSLSELKAIVETQNGAKEQSKEINGIKYVYYEYQTKDNSTVHHYMYVYDGKVYTIGFFLGENYGNIEDVFMNNVSFT